MSSPLILLIIWIILESSKKMHSAFDHKCSLIKRLYYLFDMFRFCDNVNLSFFNEFLLFLLQSLDGKDISDGCNH